jgi:hypothetical protein
MKTWTKLVFALGILGLLGIAYRQLAIPTHRVNIHSELVMMGDLDSDNRWTIDDLSILDTVLKEPFEAPKSTVLRIDMNENGMIDGEDIAILHALVASAGDPYAAEEKARSSGKIFPRPRELYHYLSAEEYRSRPLWALPYPPAADSVLDWLATLPPPVNVGSYAEALSAAVYDEAVRFDQGWRKRQAQLMPIEREYAEKKLARVKELFFIE